MACGYKKALLGSEMLEEGKQFVHSHDTGRRLENGKNIARYGREWQR